MASVAESIDAQNMKALLLDFPKNCMDAMKLGKITVPKAKEVVICGMGGSAIGGQLLAEYFTYTLAPEMYPLPHFLSRKYESPYTLRSVQCVRDYSIPSTTTNETLIIICSYSGTTEEAISCYREAMKRTKNIVVCSSGGKLQEAALRDSIPFIKLPEGLPPRTALPYLFFPLLNVLATSQMIPSQVQELDKFSVFSQDEQGSELAQKLKGKIPLFVSSTQHYSIAYRWKTQVNENAKLPAFALTVPEMNHNELCSLPNELAEQFTLVMLLSDDDQKRVQKRMTVMKELMREQAKAMKKEFSIMEIRMKAPTQLGKMFSAIHLGDWMSYHLALQSGTNPTPVELIDKFKKAMGSFL